MQIDWSTLSPPQAAVLAALIGIVAAVLGQLIGAIISTIANGRQARKLRELDERKFNQLMRRQVAETVNESRRAVYLDYLATSNRAFDELFRARLAPGSAANTQTLTDLDRTLAAVALADASEPVLCAANRLLESLQALASTSGVSGFADVERNYRLAKDDCIKAMAIEMRKTGEVITEEL